MAYHRKKIGQRKTDSVRLGVPLVVSEFGDCENTDACSMEINLVTDLCDQNLVSWAYSQYKSFGNDFVVSNEDKKGDKEGFLRSDELEKKTGLFD